MSEYSDLPDNIKKAIEDLLETLSGMTAEDIFNLLGEVMGEEGISDLSEIMEDNSEHHIDFDDWGINLDQLLEEFSDFDLLDVEEIEPYYEISHQDNEYGEIIIEMPGLSDTSMIDYYFFDNELFLHSVDSFENYKLIIPIPEYYHILEEQMIYRNGLLIIPFKIY